MTTLIELSNASFGYAGRPVVRADRLVLSAGRCLGVFGHNGSGKTTLVRGMFGLLPVVSGSVQRTQRPLRFGFLSQYRGIDLAWPMNGFDAAALNLSAHRSFGRLTTDDRRAITDALRTMEVDDLAGRAFAALSGGQQQRLLLAGALAAKPDVLVLDEPTDGLDTASRSRLLITLNDLKATGLSIVLISHDFEDLLAVSDEVAWLHPGDAGAPSSVQCLHPGSLGQQLLRGGTR